MTKIQINCPSCSKTGFIEMSPNILKDSLRGLLAINITKDLICPHSFIAYVDNNLNVRDYFVADFQIELPQITQEDIDRTDKIPSKDIVDIDLIKLNIPAMLLTYILKSIFSKQKIVLIQDNKFLHNHIHNFFNYITKNSFETNISIITGEMYKNNKKNYKDSIVFGSINILRNVKNIINPKKLSIEKQMVSRFITEDGLGNSYIFLKNDILKAFQFSKAIIDLINESKERNERINTLKIRTELEKMYFIKINIVYMNFLIEIVKHYFGVKLPSITDSFIET